MKSLNKLPYIVLMFGLFILGLNSQLHAQTVFEAQLSGSNEVPAITSMANGSVMATLDGNELTVEGSFEGLSSPLATDIAGGAHLHTGMAGENGAVIFPLTVTANGSTAGTFEAANNTFTLSSGQVDTLMMRGVYINIHSENYAGGELRGQLLPESDTYMRSNLSGAFEVPSAKTMANGSLVYELRGDSLFVSGSFTQLTDEFDAAIAGGSHLHIGSAGSNGAVAISLNATLSEDLLSGVYYASDNAFELTAEQKTALMNRMVYANIHTKAYAGGELRGQVVPANSTTFFAQLSGSAEQPSVATAASGGVVLEVQEDTLTVSGSFSGLESAFNTEVGSHLHMANAGQNGGVEVVLNADLETNMMAGTYSSENNMYTLSAEQKTALFARNMYVNVHSVDIGSGEIRGQVLGDATAYFHTNLSGWHEIQPIMSSAFGAASIEYKSNGNIILSGGFEGLSSALATDIAGGGHLHIGGVSTNGDVAIPINISVGENDTTGAFASSENMFALTTEQATALFDEQMYVNIHSADFQSGELRGQVLFASNFAPSAPVLTSPADDATLSLEGAATTTFEATWEAATDTNSNEISYIWQLSTDAEFENVVVNANVGAETSFQTDFATLDGLLNELGVEVGSTATVYHRVIASDGSDEAISETNVANLERGMLTSNEERLNNPTKFGLEQNYPNPFNPTTNISFSLSEGGETTLTVYNLLGQQVATVVKSRFSAGNHTVSFDASALSSGIYIYRLKAQNQTMTKRMTLIK